MTGVALVSLLIPGLVVGALVARRSRPADKLVLAAAACWAACLLVILVPAHLLLAFGLMVDVMSNPDGPLFAASVLGAAASGLLGLLLMATAFGRSSGSLVDTRAIGAITVGVHLVVGLGLLAGAVAMDRLALVAPFAGVPALLGLGVGARLAFLRSPAAASPSIAT